MEVARENGAGQKAAPSKGLPAAGSAMGRVAERVKVSENLAWTRVHAFITVQSVRLIWYCSTQVQSVPESRGPMATLRLMDQRISATVRTRVRQEIKQSYCHG